MSVSRRDWLGGAWDDLLDNLGALVPLTLLQAALNVPVFLAVDHWGSYLQAAAYGLLVVAPFGLGVNLFYVRLARGEKAGLRDILAAFRVYPRALAVTAALGAMTACGLLLFLLPGLVLYSMFCFSEYAVVDRRTGVKESFLLSARLTDGWKFPLALLVVLTVAVDGLVPSPVYFIGWSEPRLGFETGRWTAAAFALKTLVFLPWLHLALARAYASLLDLSGARGAAETGAAGAGGVD